MRGGSGIEKGKKVEKMKKASGSLFSNISARTTNAKASKGQKKDRIPAVARKDASGGTSSVSRVVQDIPVCLTSEDEDVTDGRPFQEIIILLKQIVVLPLGCSNSPLCVVQTRTGLYGSPAVQNAFPQS